MQVPLFACLTKFDGSTFQEMMNGDRRQYVITKLPQYLIIHIKRFSKNTQQYVEKNPTIVNFPVRPHLEYPHIYICVRLHITYADTRAHTYTELHTSTRSHHAVLISYGPHLSSHLISSHLRCATSTSPHTRS